MTNFKRVDRLLIDNIFTFGFDNLLSNISNIIIQTFFHVMLEPIGRTLHINEKESGQYRCSMQDAQL